MATTQTIKPALPRPMLLKCEPSPEASVWFALSRDEVDPGFTLLVVESIETMCAEATGFLDSLPPRHKTHPTILLNPNPCQLELLARDSGCGLALFFDTLQESAAHQISCKREHPLFHKRGTSLRLAILPRRSRFSDDELPAANLFVAEMRRMGYYGTVVRGWHVGQCATFKTELKQCGLRAPC